MILKSLFNIIGFQLSWWACVLGAGNNYPYAGPIAMALFLLTHYYFFSKNIQEIKLIIIFGLVGTLIDSFIIYTGILNYAWSYQVCFSIAPLWITAMWCGFSATINHSMNWLKNKWLIAFILGVVFGPAAYITGENFGAISFYSDLTTIVIVLSLVWGISIPLIYWVNSKLVLSNN